MVTRGKYTFLLPDSAFHCCWLHELSRAESCYVSASKKFPPIISSPSKINPGIASCACRLFCTNAPGAHLPLSRFSLKSHFYKVWASGKNKTFALLPRCVRDCEKVEGASETFYFYFLAFFYFWTLKDSGLPVELCALARLSLQSSETALWI